MRTITTAVVALGLAGAAALTVPSPSLAQGFYFSVPGVEFGVGRPWYRDRYYGAYGGAYAYQPNYSRRYYGPRGRHWDPMRPAMTWDPYGLRWDGGD